MLLGTCFQAGAQDQQYVATPVTISKDKVKDKDTAKVYFAHPALAKHTLFSICQAYGVTLEEVYEANPTLHLETEPLKQYQILRIPDKSSEPATAKSGVQAAPASAAPAAEKSQDTGSVSGDEYMIHTVKWFEDLPSIAAKYGISQEAIMKFNGLSSPVLSRKQKLKIPTGATLAQVESSLGSEKAAEKTEEDKGIIESITETITEKAESIFGLGKKDVKVALLLPFNASKSPSENNLDFYSGVLMAVRDLEKEGIKAELSVYDCGNGSIAMTEEQFGANDIVIGPVSSTDMTSALSVCPGSTVLISPLDPKTADHAKTHPNLIHAPAPADAQSQDLINWMKSEKKSGDKVILITEKNVTATSNAAALIKHLSESGIEYSTVTYGLLEGKNIASTLESRAAATGNNHIIIASESEAFVNDAVRNVNLLAYKNIPVTLYCLSRVRNFETIEVENFHSTKMHLSMGYFVDYDDAKVQRFLMEYRALFNTEPGNFAFQGYDSAYYFIKNCSKNGRNWMEKLDNSTEKGLQANFRFRQYSDGGYINDAVRRVVYGEDYSIKLVN